MVPRAEVKAARVTTAAHDSERDATWSDDAQEADTGGDDGADAWGWADSEGDTQQQSEQSEAEKRTTADKPDDEDASEAWGWEDDANDNHEDPVGATRQAVTRSAAQKPQSLLKAGPETSHQGRQGLKEPYHISSLPRPILDLVFAVLKDGATLMGEDSNDAGSPVAAAGSGLFAIPALVLAMFRAVSPHCYSLDIGGSM